MVVATFLQDELVVEVEKILKDIRLKTPDGKKSKVNVFPQYLPIPTPKRPPEGDIPPEVVEEGLAASDVETEPDPFPYVLVRVDSGEIKEIDGEQSVTVYILIGVFDDNTDNLGFKDVLEIIQRIYERFGKNAYMAEYECDTNDIEWALQEEESYPYYFGGMTLKFLTHPIRREDRLV